MKFATVFVTLSTAITGAMAAVNAFSAPLGNATLTAGGEFVISWNSTGGGSTVDLLLKKGPAKDLVTALTIATGLANEGAVRWHLPADLVTGTDYSLEIKDDESGAVNYSPQFAIDGVAPSTSTSTTTTSTTTSTSTTTVESTTSSESASTSDLSSVVSTASNSTSFTTTTAITSVVPTTSASFTNGTSTGSETGAKSTITKASSSGAASTSGAATSSVATKTNGASFVSYSSLLLAGAVAGAVFIAL